jgi:hypothetical protein
MDLELKEISLTIVTGVAMASAVVLAVRISGQVDWKIRLPQIFDQEVEGLRIFRTFVILAVVYGVGVFIEDVAKNAVAHRSPNIPLVPIDWLLPPERSSRVAPLVDNDTMKVITRNCDSTLGKQSEPKDPADIVPLIFGYGRGPQLSELGSRLLREIQDVRSAQGGLKAPAESLARFGADKAVSCVDAWRLQEIYYRAKNIVYAEDNYFDELQELYARLGFVRSMLFVAIAASLGVVLAAVRRLYRLGKGKVLSDGNEDSFRRAITEILTALVIAIVVILVAKSAYLSEEQNYNNRVYGYFDTVIFKERKAE